MANEELFNGRAGNYAQARPGYADGVMELLAGMLRPGAAVADVGSGTGIFAKSLLDRGFTVYGVEPNDGMRAEAEALLGGHDRFFSIAASAEATILADGSVDAVTAASAFHWFDAERFFVECRRILKPGGILFTVVNARDYQDEFTRRQHALCEELCRGFVSLRHGLDESVPRLKRLLGEELHSAEFDFPLTYTKEKFIKRSLSSSYAPKQGEAAYALYAQRLAELLDEFFPRTDSITVPNISAVYWCRQA